MRTVAAVGSRDCHPPCGGRDIVVRSDSLQRPRAEPRPLEGIPVFENPTFHGWCGFKDSPTPLWNVGPTHHLSTTINGYQRHQRLPTAATTSNGCNGCNGWGAITACAKQAGRYGPYSALNTQTKYPLRTCLLQDPKGGGKVGTPLLRLLAPEAHCSLQW